MASYRHLETTMIAPSNVAELQAQLRAGATFDYRLFYGHTQPAGGRETDAVFSQFYDCSFVIDGARYRWAEQWMMAEKARLFGDAAALAQVMAAASPFDAKRAGRGVRPYDDQRWSEVRFDRVVTGNSAKFGQNPPLSAHLAATESAILVEAAANDAIWGIGLSRDDPAARDPLRWRGQNLLGFALMEVRRRLEASAKLTPSP